jgi:hypothetical protein
MSNLVVITDLREGDQGVFELATILRLVRMSGRICLTEGHRVLLTQNTCK